MDTKLSYSSTDQERRDEAEERILVLHLTKPNILSTLKILTLMSCLKLNDGD